MKKNNLDLASCSGMTRRQWKKWFREYGYTESLRAKLISIQKDFYEISFRSIKNGDPWRNVYNCGRISNLKDHAREAFFCIP
jgi:hypothetical protein